MIPYLSLPWRNPKSHKGQNGVLGIIGGSEAYFGAPILALLGAEYAGADLVHLFLPPQHQAAAKAHSLNVLLHPFTASHFTEADLSPLEAIWKQCDILLIGPGVGDHPHTQKAIITLLSRFPSHTLLLDAQSLFPEILPHLSRHQVLLTPHRQEWKRLASTSPHFASLKAFAQKYHTYVLLKSQEDVFISPSGENISIPAGNALLTVGGSGDALAGIIAGFFAQMHHLPAAAISGSYFWGRAAEQYAKKYLSARVQDLLPFFAQSLRQ